MCNGCETEMSVTSTFTQLLLLHFTILFTTKANTQPPQTMNLSSNMVATRYGFLPPQNKPEEWFSYRDKFEAQADADGILEVLKGTYPAIPAPPANATSETRIHNEKKKDEKKSLEKQAWLVMIHICTHHPNLTEPHRSKNNDVKSRDTYNGILNWFGQGATNAEGNIIAALTSLKVIPTDNPREDFAIYKTKMDI